MRVIEMFVTFVPRERIPADAKWFMQDGDDGLLKCSKGKMPEKKYSRVPFWWDRGSYSHDSDYRFGNYNLASDASEIVVTREELMRAYDLTELGYTLWFGGECPVGAGIQVDYMCEGGFLGCAAPAYRVNWSKVNHKVNVIAYQISRDYAENGEVIKCESDAFGESHRYNRGNIECIDIIKEMTADKSGLEAFYVGNVVKYLYRYKDKNRMADVIKARNYLNKIIEGNEK